MNRFQKTALTLVAVGGTLTMGVTAALADDFGGQQWVSATVSSQQQGSYNDTSGATLSQTTDAQVGTTTADSYNTSTSNYGGSSTADQWNSDGQLVNNDSNWSKGGSSSTSATDYSSQVASVSQTNTQNIGNYGSGDLQNSNAAAVAGTNKDDHVSGGASFATQNQDGSIANGAFMTQNANITAGRTAADDLQTKVNNNAFGDTQNQWNADGTQTSYTTFTNNGGSTTTSYDDYVNPFATHSLSQSQTVGYGSADYWGAYGGTQSQSAGSIAGTAKGENAQDAAGTAVMAVWFAAFNFFPGVE